jgi:hypothetical protein
MMTFPLPCQQSKSGYGKRNWLRPENLLVLIMMVMMIAMMTIGEESLQS